MKPVFSGYCPSLQGKNACYDCDVGQQAACESSTDGAACIASGLEGTCIPTRTPSWAVGIGKGPAKTVLMCRCSDDDKVQYPCEPPATEAPTTAAPTTEAPTTTTTTEAPTTTK